MSLAYTSPTELAAAGLFVLPLCGITAEGKCGCGRDPCPACPGKHPRSGYGVTHATRDGGTVEGWERRFKGANFGVAAGLKFPDTNRYLLLLDLDGDPARAWYRRTVEDHGEWPRTWTVRSGRLAGGQHRYFLTDTPINGRIDPTPGVEARGRNQYVVAPGSLHQSGRRYEWIVSPNDLVRPADAPGWLVELLRQRGSGDGGSLNPGRPHGNEWAVRAAQLGEGDGRHPLLISFIGGHHSFGLDEDLLIEAALRLNRTFQTPYPDEAVRKKVADVCRRYEEGETITSIVRALQMLEDNRERSSRALAQAPGEHPAWIGQPPPWQSDRRPW